MNAKDEHERGHVFQIAILGPVYPSEGLIDLAIFGPIDIILLGGHDVAPILDSTRPSLDPRVFI